MSTRCEPLLWLQCLAFGVIPLELLLIGLLLAGADPGPFPGVERLLIWGAGVAAPCFALWKRPADWGSLLVLRLPVQNRSAEQQRISSMQTGAVSVLPLVVAALLLLIVVWWLDESAAVFTEFSPLGNGSRLGALLISTPLLALIVWQIQQSGQSLGLLLQPDEQTAADARFDASRLQNERCSFGLQLLRLSPLDWPDPPSPPATPSNASQSSTDEPDEVDGVEAVISFGQSTATDERDGEAQSSEPVPTSTVVPETLTIKPEERSEEDESTCLNSEVCEGDINAGGVTESHGEQSETGGSEKSKPNNTSESPPGSL